MGEYLPGDFGATAPHSSQAGRPIINSARVKNGQVKLYVVNQTGEYTAAVAIDKATLQLKSVTMLK